MKHALAVVCLYEAGAIWSGRYPTITSLCAKYWWLAPVLVTALAVHFALDAEKRAVPA